MTDSPVSYPSERGSATEPGPGFESGYDPQAPFHAHEDESFSDATDALHEGSGTGEYDTTYYDPADVEEELRRLRPDDAERTSWGYIGTLVAVFVFLSLAAWACDDSVEEVPELRVEEGGEVVGVSTPVRLSINVLGDIATVSGSVPDEAAKTEVLATAESIYSAENVIDQVTIDPASALDGGSVTVTGQALQDDERPGELRDALVDSLDFGDGGLEVERSESALLPAIIEGTVGPVDGSPGAVQVILSGAVPDEESLSQLQAAAEAVWGAGSVDLAGVSVGERTWDQAQVRVTGSVSAGDARHLAFPAEVTSRLDQGVIVDVSGVSIDETAVTLEDVEEQIMVAVEAQPILFAPERADIDPASDGVITEIVALLGTVPDVAVEVVGHTDDVGPDDENLTLSQNRADAVVARLVELGVAEARLNARGEGEAQPLVPNVDDESRARNRRIEFNLIRTN